MTQNHIVKKLTLDLQFHSEQQVKHLEHEVVNIYRNRIEALLDEKFSALGNDDMEYQIDTLVLDLGEIDQKDLHKEIPLRAEEQLKKKLNGGLSTTANIISEGEKKLSLFAHFIETGRLPWWGSKTPKQTLEQLVEDLIDEEPEVLKQIIEKVVKDEQKTLRLIRQFSDHCLACLSTLYITSVDVASISEQYDDLSAVLRQLYRYGEAGIKDYQHVFDVSKIGHARLRQYYWYNALTSIVYGTNSEYNQKQLLQGTLVALLADTGGQYRSTVRKLSKLTRQLQQKHYHFTSKFPQHIAVLAAEVETASSNGKDKTHLDKTVSEGLEFEQVRKILDMVRGKSSKLDAEDVGSQLIEEFIRAQETIDAARNDLSELDTTHLAEWEVEEFVRAQEAIDLVRAELSKLDIHDLEGQAADEFRRVHEKINSAFTELTKLSIERIEEWEEEEFARAHEVIDIALGEIAKLDTDSVHGEAVKEFARAREAIEAAHKELSRTETEQPEGAGTEEFTHARQAVELARSELARLRSDRVEGEAADELVNAREAIDAALSDLGSLDTEHNAEEIAEKFEHAKQVIDAALSELSSLDTAHNAEEIAEKFEHVKQVIDAARSELIRLNIRQSVEEITKGFERKTETGQQENIHRILKDDSRLSDPFTESEEIYIDNSGLVILWQYLPRFFDKLNMLDGNGFVDTDMAERAVLLLQYLVEPATEISEVLLPLNKLLCGIPLSQSLPAEIKLTDKEKVECDNLLIAMTTHWKVLENMTLDRVRVDFLQRLGILRSRDSGWDLHVESRNHDILMQKLPWTINTIRLPWMDSVIYVQWGS